jgi:hypothetical protein
MPSDLIKILYILKTMCDGETVHLKHVKCFRELTGSKNA